MFLDILENPTYCLGIPYRFLFPCTASRQPLLNPYCGNLSHNGEVLIENIQKYPTVTFLLFDYSIVILFIIIAIWTVCCPPVLNLDLKVVRVDLADLATECLCNVRLI